jgi:hypothetical protein
LSPAVRRRTSYASVVTGGALLVACTAEHTLPAGEITAPVAAMLAHLPATATVAAGVDLERARGIRLFATLAPDLPLPPEAAQIRQTCALDPLADVDLVVASLGDPPGLDRMVAAIQGRFTRETIAACAASIGARSRGRVEVGAEGALTVYSSAEGKAFAYWPDPRTLVLSPAAFGSPDVLASLPTGRGVGPDLLADVAKVRTGAALWVAGRMPAEARRRITALGPRVPDVPGFFASVDGQGDRLDVLFGLRMARAEEARGTARGFRRQKAELAASLPPAVGAIVGRLEVDHAGRDVVIRTSLTTAEAQVLLTAAAGLGAP